MLSYGHGAIYSQKAFQLLERLGWERADTVLPHLVPTIVYGTREDKLPYMRLFHRGLAQLDLDELTELRRPRPALARTTAACWRRCSGATAPRRRCAAGAALHDGAGIDGLFDAVSTAVSERMLRYDVGRRASTSTTTSAGSTSPTG